MDKEERKKYAEAIERNALESAAKEPYPLWRRSRWDEWGSPVGLTIAWALFIIPIGVFLYLLHLAGLVR